jgi:ABC-type polysaccharide/polyol phosphate transport system ATPase subunit
MEPRVRVEGLWEWFRAKRVRGRRLERTRRWALQDVSLTVNDGELVGVIGANGSGKTTLLRSVAGVLPPAQGRVIVRGRAVPFIDLNAGSHRELSGKEHVMITGVLLGLSRRDVRSKFSDIAALSGIGEDALAMPMRSYSAGMMLRLGFALAVHCEPDVLLVDEIVAAGDEAFQRSAVEKIAELRAGGCAVMLASHDLHLIGEHCDRVAVLQHGKLSFEGAPAQAIEHYLELSKTSD